MYIGIDCGTQSTKAVIVDVDNARILAEASCPHNLIQNSAGRREQWPDEWSAALTHAVLATIDEAGVSPKSIKAIGVSGQQHGMVALDASGTPVYPAKLWCDTETADYNAALLDKLGGPVGSLDKLGLVMQTGYTASKIAWLRETHPDAYAKIDKILLPHDYLNYWLTGECVAEAGDASGTGYFDTRTRKWRHDVFSEIAPELDPFQILPRLIDAQTVVGTVLPAIARELGLSDNVLVSSGGGDNMMGAIGTGNIMPGLVTMSLGTSGTVGSYSPVPVVPDSDLLANFCDSTGGWLPLICTMNVTSATTQLQKLFNLDIGAFNAQVEEASIGAGGVVVLPFFNGERVPALPQSTASFSGLTSTNTTPANLCRATLEAATFGLRFGLEQMGDQSGLEQVRLIGGGAKSAVWRQITADVIGVDVVCPKVTDAAAFGAAIQAAWCHLGEKTTLVSLCERLVHLDDQTHVSPIPKNVIQYREAYARYRDTLARRYGVSA